ncbi:putative signal peptide peptidase, putative,aspartic peptidase, clan AD, family A22B [Trypanosoma grayi]|uniref:putative signal peptide peptidase, putative,aspartic peptidase, clan AD, family A22B n=1 Tax=Trypanosoma grayi TaxID=71804 RepID=UPI0004F4B736|nr:putative signal peptide peptidase, putative,aspartic peptidase, clan AD, family A22B [Trypanosoma grayi]KEG14420.1 putative signal peptide peptidase, putative,aspartic peptidase, clan AD, family A22B [Trypanosoma grayi]
MSQISERVQLYIALGYLAASAVFVVYLGGRRLFQRTLEMKKTHGNPDEVMGTGDAMALPVMGSMVLFSIYVLLRFVPLEYFNAVVSFYLSVIGIFCLGSFIKAYVRPNILTGITCCVVGGVYYWTNSWIANNLLSVAIGVTAIEAVHIGSFKSAFVLLIGLFLYDIFWVFGSDVMLTVASGVNGPIKLLFPRTVFGDHQSKSLLGLGDLIIPGFFIAQTLIFSSEYVKRGSYYFHVALVAYALSLANTMGVMIIFEHGQPALLFIVPWLLITFLVAAMIKGDLKAAFVYTSDDVTEPTPDTKKETSEGATVDRSENDVADDNDGDDDSLIDFLLCATLELFGWESKKKKEHSNKVSLKKKNS